MRSFGGWLSLHERRSSNFIVSAPDFCKLKISAPKITVRLFCCVYFLQYLRPELQNAAICFQPFFRTHGGERRHPFDEGPGLRGRRTTVGHVRERTLVRFLGRICPRDWGRECRSSPHHRCPQDQGLGNAMLFGQFRGVEVQVRNFGSSRPRLGDVGQAGICSRQVRSPVTSPSFRQRPYRNRFG